MRWSDMVVRYGAEIGVDRCQVDVMKVSDRRPTGISQSPQSLYPQILYTSARSSAVSDRGVR